MGDVVSPLFVTETGTTSTVKQYISDQFGFERSFLKWSALGLAGWAIFFAIIFVLAIKFLDFQRR